MPASATVLTRGQSAWTAAAAALVVAFVVSRALLVATSYDSVANWEEPVFLYGALEIHEHGIASIFDYQDDLNHGGSVPLMLIASQWVPVFGARLDALKAVAILWSTLTLIATMTVAWRYVSPAAAILAGLLYAALSRNAARLQVTLVGSHPEAVLFVVLALGCYWQALENASRRNRRPRRWASLLLGVFSGLAMWCSYLAAPLVAPLLAFHAVRQPRRAAESIAGLAVGVLPWVVQNVWLRPYGASQWRERVAYFHEIRGHKWDGLEILERVARSFGFGEPVGAFVFVVFVALALVVVALSLARNRSPIDDGSPAALDAWGTLPLALGALSSILLIAYAQPNTVPTEGYYYNRFFIPLQCALYWLATLAIAELGRGMRARAYAAAYVMLVAAWIGGQASLYGLGNDYVPDLARDRTSGCAVFGHAELDRAGDYARARDRLKSIADDACRLAAFTGYGWALVSRYARDGHAEELADALDGVDQEQLRSQACAAARQLMATIYPEAITDDRRRTGALYLDKACG